MKKLVFLLALLSLALGGCATGFKDPRPVGDVKPLTGKWLVREAQYALPYVLFPARR